MKKPPIFVLVLVIIFIPTVLQAEFIECEVTGLPFMGMQIDQVFKLHMPEEERSMNKFLILSDAESGALEEPSNLMVVMGSVKITEYIDREGPTETKSSTEHPFYIFQNSGKDVRGFYIVNNNVNVIDIGFSKENRLEMKRLDTWLDNYSTGPCKKD